MASKMLSIFNLAKAHCKLVVLFHTLFWPTDSQNNFIFRVSCHVSPVTTQGSNGFT